MWPWLACNEVHATYIRWLPDWSDLIMPGRIRLLTFLSVILRVRIQIIRFVTTFARVEWRFLMYPTRYKAYSPHAPPWLRFTTERQPPPKGCPWVFLEFVQWNNMLKDSWMHGMVSMNGFGRGINARRPCNLIITTIFLLIWDSVIK